MIGELSNDSQPMRRFLQTFVLVPRSQTNYYVRTDIFRYTDQDDEELNEQERTLEDNDERVETPNKFSNNSQPTENNTVASCPAAEVVVHEEVNGEAEEVQEPERPSDEGAEKAREILEKTKIESPVNNNIDEGYNEGEDRLVNDSSGSHGSDEQGFEHNHDEANNQDGPKTYANMVSRNPPGNAIHSPPFNHSTNSTAKPSDGATNVMSGNAAFKNKSW